MVEAWFSPEAAYGFSALSLLGFTALAVPAIVKGRHRAAVLSVWTVIIVLGLALTGVGLTALAGGQPAHVTLPFLLSGTLMALGYAFSLIFVVRGYRLAEHRRMVARDL